MDVAAPGMMSVARPGKSGQSVGHMAKAAVAEARAAGNDLPSNAQGMAASRIAQGADPASVFAAMVAPEPEGDAGDVASSPVAAPDDAVTPPPAEPAAEAAEAGYAEAAELLEGEAAVQNGAEIALALLEDAA